jgi:chloramphenicol-sensitive protein RarD
VTFAICVGYPVYFILRRRHRLDGPVAFGGEMLVLAPVVLVAMATADPASSAPATLAGLAGVGLFTAAAMAGYLAAARLLTLPVFGLASYVEPVLLVVVSLLLGESFHGAGDLFVYLAIALALAVLALDGLRAMRTLPRPRP